MVRKWVETIANMKSPDYKSALAGTWAQSKGYNGLIVNGARGNKDYVNLIIFNQSDVDKALGKIVPTIINN